MKVDISTNELVDRLRVLQSKLTEQNEHSDALFVGFAIQSILEGTFPLVATESTRVSGDSQPLELKYNLLP